MFQTLRNAWKVDDLRRKILFTLFIVLLFRIGHSVPVPYVDVEMLRAYMDSMKNTFFGLMEALI